MGKEEIEGKDGQPRSRDGNGTGTRPTLDEVGSDVDNDTSGLEPLSLDEVSLSDSGDHNVGVLELWRRKRARKRG